MTQNLAKAADSLKIAAKAKVAQKSDQEASVHAQNIADAGEPRAECARRA
jgi:hypothetical protein